MFIVLQSVTQVVDAGIRESVSLVSIDSTACHGQHLFDVNCRICTGTSPLTAADARLKAVADRIQRAKAALPPCTTVTSQLTTAKADDVMPFVAKTTRPSDVVEPALPPLVATPTHSSLPAASSLSQHSTTVLPGFVRPAVPDSATVKAIEADLPVENMSSASMLFSSSSYVSLGVCFCKWSSFLLQGQHSLLCIM